MMADDKLTALSPEMVLMACDVVESRQNLYHYMCLDSRVIPLKDDILAVITTVGRLFPLCGTETYEVIGNLEALCQSCILRKEEENPGRRMLWDATCAAMVDCSDNPLALDIIFQLIDLYNGFYKKYSAHQLAEFMCCYRLWGHPHLDARTATDKVRGYMESEIPIDIEVNKQIYSMWFLLVVNGYMKRNGGIWPPILIDEALCPRLHRARRESRSLIPDEALLLKDEIYLATFEKSFEIKLDEDVSIFLRDRAISPVLKEWDSVFNRETMPYDPPRASKTRRLVSHFIDDRNFDPEKYIDYVTSGKYLSDPDFNISYSLKEREVKVDGRLFAKMTPMMRGAQTVHEHLLATGVGRLFDANGVVKSEHELLTHIHRMSMQSTQPVTDNQSGEYVTQAAFLTTDIKKYCLSFRREVMARFAQACDELYGIPRFFNWQHEILEQSQIYVADPYCPPSGLTKRRAPMPPPDGDIVINNPLGCIEGFQQKGWTMFSIAALLLASTRVGARISAIVQGDNQVVAITLRCPPDSTWVSRKRDALTLARNFSHALAEILVSQGQILKESETIISSSFFIYGKRILREGAMLPQCLKAASRILLHADTLLDDTRSALSNIATSCTKVLNQGGDPRLCFLLTLFHSCRQLAHSLWLHIDGKISVETQTFMQANPEYAFLWLLTPSHLGGLMTFSHTRMFVRNIGDPLVAAIADLKRMCRCGLMPVNWANKFLDQPVSDLSWAQWGADPYGLNIPSTVTLTKIVEDLTQRGILSSAKNPVLKDLFHVHAQTEDESVSKYFLDLDVIMPRVAHAIIELTPTGERRMLARLVDTTKTVIMQSAARGGLEPRTVARILTYEENQIRRLFLVLRSTGDAVSKIGFPYICSVDLARALRQHSWREKARGREIKGLEVPDIIEACCIEKVQAGNPCQECQTGNLAHIWARVPTNVEIDDITEPTVKMRTPYFGSMTSEKSNLSLHKIPGLSRAARRAIRLSMLCTWVFGSEEQGWEIATYFANSRAAFTKQELRAITPIVASVNISHRLHESSTQNQYNSAREGRATRYAVLSTDNFQIARDGDPIDTNFVFQTGMLALFSVIEDHYRLKTHADVDELILHLHISSPCCIKPVPPDPPQDPPASGLPVVRISTRNALVYDALTITEQQKSDTLRVNLGMHTLVVQDWPLMVLAETGSRITGSLVFQTLMANERSMARYMIAEGDRDCVVGQITSFLTWSPLEILFSCCANLLIHLAPILMSGKTMGVPIILARLTTVLFSMSSSNLTPLRMVLEHDRVLNRLLQELQESSINRPRDFRPGSPEAVVCLLIQLCECLLLCPHYQKYWQNVVCSSDSQVREAIIERRTRAYLRYAILWSMCGYTMETVGVEQSIQQTVDDLACNATVLHELHVDTFRKSLQNHSYPAPEAYLEAICVTEWTRRGQPPVSTTRRSSSPRCTSKVDLLASLRRTLEPYPNQIAMVPCITFPKMRTHNVVEAGTSALDPQRDDRSYELRTTGLASTSHYKFWSLLFSLRDSGQSVQQCLCLAEGSGSVMAAIKLMFPDCVVFYNSLLRENRQVEQRAPILYPDEYHTVIDKPRGASSKSCCVLFDGSVTATDLT